eukprot:3685455-Pyramimonas_sp.AAC.1
MGQGGLGRRIARHRRCASAVLWSIVSPIPASTGVALSLTGRLTPPEMGYCRSFPFGFWRDLSPPGG